MCKYRFPLLLPRFQPKRNYTATTPNKNSRELILKVLNTVPSKREARNFVERFANVSKSTYQVPENTSSSVNASVDSSSHFLQQTTPLPISLVKLQGPFQQDHLSNACSTLTHLQKLGLSSVVVIDNGEYSRSDVHPTIDALVEGENWFSEIQRCRLLSKCTSQPLREEYEEGKRETRKSVLNFALQTTEAIESAGGRGRPIYSGIFRFNSNFDHPKELGDMNLHKRSAQPEDDETIHLEVDIGPLVSAISLGHIPIIVPQASTSDGMHISLPADACIASLARSLASNSNVQSSHGDFSLTMNPVRIVVINSQGGIPAGKGTREKSLAFVNLQDEFDTIQADLQQYMVDVDPSSSQTHTSSSMKSDLFHQYRNASRDMSMLRPALSYLPGTASAVICSASAAPTALIRNLITDKPLLSSSMPTDPPLTSASVHDQTTTVLRHGLRVRVHTCLETVDKIALQRLLEASFGKSLDAESYWARLKSVLSTVIVAGDYAGAAIVTMESPDDDEGCSPMASNSYAYLDKFSVAPTSQGTGVADILWTRLLRSFPNLTWRSRASNGVNKWYFERCDGDMRIPGTPWILFWYGGKKGVERMEEYVKITRKIPASFV